MQLVESRIHQDQPRNKKDMPAQTHLGRKLRSYKLKFKDFSMKEGE
jgi:hypothetical protein